MACTALRQKPGRKDGLLPSARPRSTPQSAIADATSWIARSWSQRDHDLAVDVAPGLQCHGVADLLDREDRGDGHG
jgi:hypothetical protein